jgi:hypothetical protein
MVAKGKATPALLMITVHATLLHLYAVAKENFVRAMHSFTCERKTNEAQSSLVSSREAN